MGAPDDIWNHRVDNDAVDPNSAALIDGTDSVERHAFYAAQPLNYTNRGTNATAVIPAIPSGRGPTSVGYLPEFYFEANPPNHTAQGGDSHFIFLNTQACIYTELYAASQTGGRMNFYDGFVEPTAKANSGRVLGMQLPNWYVTAGGLGIMVPAVKYEEIVAGTIAHATIMSLNPGNVSSTKYVYPGGPQVGSTYRGTGTPLMYASHLRLKASYNDPTASPQCNVVLIALKHYGTYVNDQSSNGVDHAIYFMNGASDPLGTLYRGMDFGCLGRLHLQDFDVLTPVVRP